MTKSTFKMHPLLENEEKNIIEERGSIKIHDNRKR
jgi:hypothetical protein